MNWLHSLLISFLSGILGILLGGLLGMACVKWFRITSFEGASGYAMVGIAILGGFVSAIIGLIAARWNADPSFGAGLMRAALSVGATALFIAGVCRLFADPLAFEKEDPAPPVEPEAEVDRFALPASDAPLSQWLSVISHGAPEATMSSVVSAVAKRPLFPAEAREIIFGEDDYLAAAAFRMLAQVPHPAADWKPLLSEAGVDIARRIQVALARPVEEDPSFREVAYLAIRFYGWVETAQALREAGGDEFKAELAAILAQAETNTESTVLRDDVCRVARHHLEKWAGSGN